MRKRKRGREEMRKGKGRWEKRRTCMCVREVGR